MQVTILIVTDSGCEDACMLEVARWTKAKTKKHLNIVEVAGTIEDAAMLGYHLQTARRVLIQLVEPLASHEDLEGVTPDAKLMDEIFPESLTFKAEVDVLSKTLEAEEERDEEDEMPIILSSQEFVESVGGWAHNLGRTVKLSHPDVIVYGVATPEKIFVGLDVIGKPLAKRDWRIMLSRRSLKSTIAAATVLYAGVKEKEVTLDPLGDDGTIVIEAALMMTKTSPLFFARAFAFQKFPAFKDHDFKAWKQSQDARKEIEKITAYGSSLQEMKAIRTNSKLAGVEKDIHATKVTMEWVETKFGEKAIDRIITAPIFSGKSVDEKRALKLTDELFYQAEFVLKKNRTMTCITEKPDELLPAADKYGFTKTEQRDVLMGLRRMSIVTFKNEKKKAE